MMFESVFPKIDLPDLFVLYIALGFAAAALLFMAVLVILKYRKLRGHINRRILPMEQTVTPLNAVYLHNAEGEGTDGIGFSLSVEWLDKLILYSGLKLTTGRLIFLMAGIFSVSIAGATSLGMSLNTGIPTAMFLGFAGPILVIKFIKARRMKKFAVQFVEAIELIVRSLKAGHPVPSAIKMVSQEMQDPIGSEFSLITDEVSYGSDLVTAIQGMQKRVDYEDLTLFVTAISIQSTTGGNLSVILEGLASVLRKRAKLRRKVKAAAAEGRASALILNAVPVAVMLFISIFTPDYYGAIIHEEFIIIGLASAFGWMMTGNLIMYKMMNFKV